MNPSLLISSWVGKWLKVQRSRFIASSGRKAWLRRHVRVLALCSRTPACVCTVSDSQADSKTCLCDEWHCKHWTRTKQSPEDGPRLNEISRESPYQACYGPFLCVKTECALHPNVIIYSSLSLNAAVNTPSDSITLCPHCSTGESCLPLINDSKKQ